MQHPDDLEHLDPALRRTLDADPGVAERIARRALETAAPVRRWQPAAAAALASAALIVALIWIGPRLRNNPAPPEGAAISITNIGGVIAVEDRSGSAAIVQIGDETDAAADTADTAAGEQIFISMGENR